MFHTIMIPAVKSAARQARQTRALGWTALAMLAATSTLLTACGSSTTTPAATISSFTAVSTYSYGASSTKTLSSITLTWSVSGASSITIDNGGGTYTASSGSVTISSPSASTFTLTATNSAGATTKQSVTAAGPDINYFTPSTQSITVGNSATLSWSVSSSASVSVDSSCTVSSSSCSLTPTAAGATTVTLTATDSAGDKSTATAKVIAYAAPTVSGFAPAADTIIASTATGGAGNSSTTLSWTAGSAVTAVTITDSNSATICSASTTACSSGVTAVSPTADDTYTITVANAAGTTATTTATVDVMTLSTPTAASSTVNLGGSGTTLSWTVTHASSLVLKATDASSDVASTTLTSTQTSASVTPTSTTTYALTATDDNGDTIVLSTSVSVISSLGAIYSFLANNPQNATSGIYVASASSTYPTVTMTLVMNNSDVFNGSTNSSPSYAVVITNNVDSSSFYPLSDTSVTTTVGTSTTAYTWTLSPSASTTYTLTVTDTQSGVAESQVQTLRVIYGDISIYSGQALATKTACTSSVLTFGASSSTRYCTPGGLAIDSNGDLYLADQYADIIDKVVPDSTYTSVSAQYAGTKVYSGITEADSSTSPLSAVLVRPQYLAYDNSTGNLYEFDAKTAGVRKVTSSGVTTIAGVVGVYAFSYDVDDIDTGDSGATAGFYAINQLLVDSVGDVIVVEPYSIRAIDTSDNVTTIAGQCTSSTTCPQGTSYDSTGTAIEFNMNYAAAIDSNDVIWVADQYALRKITPTKGSGTKASEWTWTSSTLFNSTQAYADVDGPASVAAIKLADSMTTDADGAVYISDYTGCLIRRFTPNATGGVLDTIAGTGTCTPITSDTGLPATVKYGSGMVADTANKRLFFDSASIASIYTMPY